MKRSLAGAAVVATAMVVSTTTASAHIERASYWPDPGPDTSLNPHAGGAVPKSRSLYSALDKSKPGDTRIVCASGVPSRRRIFKLKRAVRSARRHHRSSSTIRSLRRKLKRARRSYRRKVGRQASIKRLQRSIRSARAHGYHVRASETRSLSRRQGRRLRTFNERLLTHCHYHSIQDAVNRSHNNDRVVVMPAIYTEPKSRSRPPNDPKCTSLKELNDESNTGAVSYRYQSKCPNDQNLIAVMGRRPNGSPPQPPRDDRHGIPDLGGCIRCNFQIEGSGVGPDDVVVDAGRVASGNHAPIDPKKDVGIRADRADGFVLANMTVRHAGEHDIYILESDGYLLDRFKTFYGGEYGVLTFVEDHGLMQNCEAAGNGDSGLYPGAGAPVKPRYSQELRFCDSHHNAGGYSGTDGSSTHVHDINFYDNALGFTTDVFTASGHPGYPQHSDLIEHNNFYSNNFNPYVRGSDIDPTIPVPVGTGLWVAGGNDNVIRNNHFWDNWRRGEMIFTVPDAFVCGNNPVAGNNHQAGCQENGRISTSFDNHTFGNVMGRRPDRTRDPNGTDFWWDRFPNQQYHSPPTTTGNCWFNNTGKDGTAASVTSDPPAPLLPSNCNLSLGSGGATNDSELLACFAAFQEGVGNACDWFTTPAEPH